MADDPPTAATEPVAVQRGPSRWRALAARVLRLTAMFIVLLALGLGAAAVALFYPYVRDDLRIDGIVRVVALDWRDFGQAKAAERLRFEFASQAIGRHASPADCSLDEVEGERAVQCTWVVNLRLGKRVWPLTFDSAVRVLPNGDLTTP